MPPARYGVACLLPEFSAEATARFVREILVPIYRLTAAAPPHRRRLGGPSGGRGYLPPPRYRAHANTAAPCLDQRLRRAAPRHDPARTLPVECGRRYLT